MTMDENTQNLLKKLFRGGNITVVAGRRGSGKSGFGFRILEDARNASRETYAVGFPPEAKQFLPGYINLVDNLTDAKNGSLVLMDEAVLQYNARAWNKSGNTKLLEIIDLARHRDLAVIFIAINTAMLDPNILRAIDTLILKEPSLLQEFMERPFLKKFMNVAMTAFKDIPANERPAHSYVFDDTFEGMIRTELPTFWSEDLSKSWKNYAEAENQNKGGIKVIGAGSLPMGERSICFDCYNFVHTEYEAWCAIGLDVGVPECPHFQAKKKQKVWNLKPKKQKIRSPFGSILNNPHSACDECQKNAGVTEGGVFCNHFAKPVKYVEGECPFQVLTNPGYQEHEKWATALKLFARFDIRWEGKTLYPLWIEWAKQHGITLIGTHREGASESYLIDIDNQKTKVTLHPTPTKEKFSEFPIVCGCQKWGLSRVCEHAEKLAEGIIEFSRVHGLRATGTIDVHAIKWHGDYPEHEGGEGSEPHPISGGGKDGGDTSGGEGGEGEGGSGEGEDGDDDTCEECGGYGETESGEPCKKCGGTGKAGGEDGDGDKSQPSGGEGGGGTSLLREGMVVKIRSTGKMGRIVRASPPDADGRQEIEVEIEGESA